MEWIQNMNAAVNYIEEHILEEPDLDKPGKLAGCSAHHFQRIFTCIGGITLTEYIRKSRREIRTGDQSSAFWKRQIFGFSFSEIQSMPTRLRPQESQRRQESYRQVL